MTPHTRGEHEPGRKPESFSGARPGAISGPALEALPAGLRTRYEALLTILEEMSSVLVAFSGGVDSTLLLRAARDVLGERATGLLAISPSLPRREREEALRLADAIGVSLVQVQTREGDLEAYARNGEDRCYHCKGALLERAFHAASELGLAHVVLGTNHDDMGDHRPGHRAALERGARHPLLEAELTKSDIRQLSRALALPTWDKPELACLASRIPYGTRVTPGRLRMVERLEDHLRDRGFRQVRVRFHDQVARIEVAPEEMSMLLDPAERAAATHAGREAGFRYVALDLEGYRRGALNETLEKP